MGAPRRRNLIAHRRRTDDDGEEEGDIAAAIDDDSSSQGSIVSDLEEDADAEGSESSEVGTPNKLTSKKKSGEKKGEQENGKASAPAVTDKGTTFAATMTDTEAMLNGMNISENGATAEEIHFDDDPNEVKETPVEDVSVPARPDNLVERKRREHEEYKKKRDEDPSFVPNRGGFFMHDHRSAAPGQNGFRPSGRGRGRGARGGAGASFIPPAYGNNSSNPADAPWAHDLHEAVVDEAKSEIPKPTPTAPTAAAKSLAGPQKAPPPNRTFSRSTHVGNIQLRVFLPGMKEPIFFSAVPVHSHTRLPHHRPPLRRDKPVRISLPNNPPRYIFPAVDRSFIFIPRALRPNQQGFHRGRGRGSFGGYGSFASGRNSVYGGSTYSPSVAMSRRSSIARDMGRDGMVSPSGSVMSRNRSIVDMSKPVVRLPPNESPYAHPQYHPGSFPNTPAPIVNLPMAQAYPLPQNPLSTETLPSNLPMHQPRPQKAVSVAGIESPADHGMANFHAPPHHQHQQPFHQQVPMAINGQGFVADPNTYPHSRHPSHPSQHGTPLSQIPERAIHAQPFQPYPYQQPAYYPQQQYPGPVYYYPSPAPPMVAPFVPGQQYSYAMPVAPAMPEPTSQAGTMAYESNGTVYFHDSSHMAPSSEDTNNYPQMAYAPQPNYMMAQPAVYYPPAPQ